MRQKIIDMTRVTMNKDSINNNLLLEIVLAMTLLKIFSQPKP